MEHFPTENENTKYLYAIHNSYLQKYFKKCCPEYSKKNKLKNVQNHSTFI